MKLLGTLLILCGAVGGCLLRRQEELLPLRLGRALLEDLAVLSYQIRVCRTPLPVVLSAHLEQGLGTVWLWGPLLARLETPGETHLPACWEEIVGNLPPPLNRYLLPLGVMLPAGGDRLESVIEETREELTRFLREETARQACQGRITAALYLSGACLLILVLI